MTRPFLETLAGIVGPTHVLTQDGDMAPFLNDWRGRYQGKAQAVVEPATTGEIAALVRACYEQGVPVVPQGGNTGLCGGATPDMRGRALVVNLSRLNRLRALDPDNNTITVEAGCTLASVQAMAAEAGCLFPLSLASEGSCQIGGNLSTNAGGVHVLRYGNMRELTLGLEVVLPGGEVWDGLRGLRKDNTGYDLKQCFIGAEGTLGIITAAVLKLFPLPGEVATAWVSLPSPQAALALLRRMQCAFGARLTAFEWISCVALDLVRQHFPDIPPPFSDNAILSSPCHVLLELSDSGLQGDGGDRDNGLGALQGQLEKVLVQALEQGEISDAALAHSVQQRKNLWAARENISEAQKIDGISIKHDISLPISRIPEFLDQAAQVLHRHFPGVRIVAFGHLGDGNLHYNLSLPADNSEIVRHQEVMNRVVHDQVAALGGSISAEHGLGQLKREEILRYKSAVETGLQRSLKQAFDPRGLMNPGKVV